MYYLTAVFNGETFTKRPKTNDDVRSSLLSLKPAQLHTDIFVTLKKKQDIRERHLTLTQGKKLFNNEDFLDVFIMNLLLN